MSLIRVARCIFRVVCRIRAILLLRYIFGLVPMLQNLNRGFVALCQGVIFVENPLRLGRGLFCWCRVCQNRLAGCKLRINTSKSNIQVISVLLQVNAVRTSFHFSVRPWLVPSSFRLSGSISRTVGNKQAIPLVKCVLSLPSTPCEVCRSVLRKLLGGVGNLITQGRYTMVCTCVCSRCTWMIRVIL